MSESILITDTDVAPVGDAVALLDGWRAERRAPDALASALGEPGVRALLLTTDDPSVLRSSVELAHARGVPVLVGCTDEAARRRAVELKAEEWFLLPATAAELSARIWSAVARGAGLGPRSTVDPGLPRLRLRPAPLRGG